MNAQECATGIVKKLVKAGYIAYFAGGWVRDHLLRHESSDIDIATNAPPQVILDLFPNTILVGLSFGVVIVIIQGYQFEVATFRKDVNYVNGRKPEQIELSTPQEDAYRRDITINGMFYDPLTETIYDYVGGVTDLKKGIIRAIGDPNERFIEDRLRMIRTIRFACRFGFAIDPETQEAIAENAPTLFPAVAMERIWQEFNKMNATPNFDHALIEMHRLGLLSIIFPELDHVHLHEIKSAVSTFSHFAVESPTVLYLLALFPATPLETVIDICQKLRMSNQDIAVAKLAIECRELIQNPTPDRVKWVHFYAQPGSEVVLMSQVAKFSTEKRLELNQIHEKLKQELILHITRVSERTPLVSATILMNQGIPSGKLIGTLMKKAEQIAILNDLHTPEEVLKELLK